MSANQESIKILGYPNLHANVQSLDEILMQKVLSFLPRELDRALETYAIQFQSGRRLYHCRVFIVEDFWGEMPEKRIALVMERGLPESAHTPKQKRIHAGMYEDPFSFTPDPRYYQGSRGNNEVFNSLRNMITKRCGIGVVLAQAGMGKTTLLGYFVKSLCNDADFAEIQGSFKDNSELVRSVMASLGVKRISRNPDENLRLFKDWLLLRNRLNQRVVLICDNAQNLDAKTIQNLCLLSELGGWPQKLVQIVFAGRQELAVRLSEPALAEVSKNINVFCRLHPMDQAEVHSYVLHRLRIAGCNRQLFSHDALSAVALYSRGIPLNVHMICRHCISMAASNNLPIIDEKIVADSAYDLVLRTQPTGASVASAWLIGGEDAQPSHHRRDRRGLRLVNKP